jgi:hypothetical protein
MHSSVPERIRPALAALSVACLFALLGTFVPTLPPTSVRAANDLDGGSVSPPSGMTSTLFVFTVVHTSAPQGFTPSSVAVDVAGLNIPMTAVGGEDPISGITYRSSPRTLPAGSWTATIHAQVQGGIPDAEVIGPIQVTQGPTPVPTATPAPTPTPIPTATPAPTPTPTPLPPGVTPRPTPRPTPLPPGVTPRPATPMPQESEAAVSVSAGPSDSGDPHPSETAEAEQSASPGASGSADPTPAASGAPDVGSERGGFGQVGWIVLGGMTSVAGAAVLGRQWRMRRRA